MIALVAIQPSAVLSQERSGTMKITSTSFEHEGMIDRKYTCDGADTSPQLAWSGVPEGTKSFALACTDPDAPMGTFVHWMIYDIPASVTGIPEGGPIPEGAKLVKNDFGKKEYGGPCPPGGTHRYYFTVYALDTDAIRPANKTDFFAQVEANSIDEAQIMGKYKRQR